MASGQFSLCWDNFHKNMSSGMQSLLESEDLVDVTLAVEGRHLKAHKMVLSVCSPYFRELFQGSPCKHPIIFMKDVSYIVISDLLQFMYQGEVQVAQENLSTFIKTAEALQIKGLTEDNGNQNDESAKPSGDETTVIDSTKRSHQFVETKSAAAGPASKRPRYTLLTAESTPVLNLATTVTTASNNEGSLTSTALSKVEMIQFKMEPSEAEQPQIEAIDDSERYGDESTADDVQDDTEDYALMESGDDEPKAGTSADEMGDSQEFNTKLLAAVTHIKEQNDMIIALLDNKVSPNKSILPSDFPVELPIKNEDDLKIVEDYIDKRQNFSNLVAFLAGLGGKNHISKTNRMLRYLITDEFATNYNFHGHRQKQSFNSLKLKSAVVDAIKSTCATTNKDVEDCIKIYLKHAPQRSSRKNIKR